jgi:hypothetical protein
MSNTWTGMKKLLENLKKADPERIKRLEDMGFDTSQVMFHGSRLNPVEFTKLEGANDATYLSKSPEFASLFAGNNGGTVYPVFIKKGNYFDANNPDHLLKVSQNYPKRIVNGDRYLGSREYMNNKNYWSYIEPYKKEIKGSGFDGMNVVEQRGNTFTKNPNVVLDENIAVFNPQTDVKSIWAKGLKPGLMGGYAAVPTIENPLSVIGKAFDEYEKVKNKVAKEIVRRTDISRMPEKDIEKTANILQIAADPLNLVEGPVGLGINAIQMMSDKK